MLLSFEKEDCLEDFSKIDAAETHCTRLLSQTHSWLSLKDSMLQLLRGICFYSCLQPPRPAATETRDPSLPHMPPAAIGGHRSLEQQVSVDLSWRNFPWFGIWCPKRVLAPEFLLLTFLSCIPKPAGAHGVMVPTASCLPFCSCWGAPEFLLLRWTFTFLFKALLLHENEVPPSFPLLCAHSVLTMRVDRKPD